MTLVTEVVSKKKHLDTLTTNQLLGQLFAILAMFKDITHKNICLYMIIFGCF